MEQLEEFAREFVSEYPEHGQEVADLLQLCRDEIESGESEVNEIYLCRKSIEQLLEE
jgi:hypothetical protein